MLALQRRLLAELRARRGASRTAEELAAAVGADDDVEDAYRVLVHLAASHGRGIVRSGRDSDPRGARFGIEG